MGYGTVMREGDVVFGVGNGDGEDLEIVNGVDLLSEKNYSDKRSDTSVFFKSNPPRMNPL